VTSKDPASTSSASFSLHHPRALSRPDEPYLHLIEKISFKPIFIMGDARSGTTVLYHLLARTGCFNIVTVYDVACYHELLKNHFDNRTKDAKEALAREFEASGVIDRKIDKVKVMPSTPAEYGWFMEEFPRKVRRKTLPLLVDACRKIQYLSDTTKPLLLKNPPDYPNFLRVLELFPEAQLIFNHRNPLEVVNSWLKAARNTFGTKNPLSKFLGAHRYETLWTGRFRHRRALLRFLFSDTLDLGARISTTHVASAANYLLDHIGEIPTSRYTHVRYEDLCASPDKVITSVLDFLGLTPTRPIDFADLIKFREPQLLPTVSKRLPDLDRKLARYCKAFDYPLPGETASARYGTA